MKSDALALEENTLLIFKLRRDQGPGEIEGAINAIKAVAGVYSVVVNGGDTRSPCAVDIYQQKFYHGPNGVFAQLSPVEQPPRSVIAKSAC